MPTFLEQLAEELKGIAKTSPDLIAAFKMIANSLYEHRLANHGYMPAPIYIPVKEMGGTDAAFEVVVRVIKNSQSRYLLKRRSQAEADYHGSLHVIGTSVRGEDQPSDILDRLSVEIFGEAGKLSWKDLEKIGTAIYDESPVRRTISVTTVFMLTISEDQRSELTEGWEVVEDFNASDIIPIHAAVLRWTDEEPTRLPIMRASNH